jgi:hypothetical protein
MTINMLKVTTELVRMTEDNGQFICTGSKAITTMAAYHFVGTCFAYQAIRSIVV